MAQQDVRQHYDTYDTIQVLSYLHTNQVDPALLSLSLRLMTAPKIIDCYNRSARSFFERQSERVRGGLTGTRVAGALGRVPVEESARSGHCAPAQRPPDRHFQPDLRHLRRQHLRSRRDACRHLLSIRKSSRSTSRRSGDRPQNIHPDRYWCREGCQMDSSTYTPGKEKT